MPPNILSLPGPVLDQMLFYLIPTAESIPLVTDWECNDQSLVIRDFDGSNYYTNGKVVEAAPMVANALVLRRVCRLFYEEVSRLFFSRNTWIFASPRCLRRFIDWFPHSRRLPIRSVILCVNALYDPALLSNDFNRIKYTTDLCRVVTSADFPYVRNIMVRFPRFVCLETNVELQREIHRLMDIRSLEQLLIRRTDDMSLDDADSGSNSTSLDLEERDGDIFANSEETEHSNQDMEDTQAKLARIQRIRFEDDGDKKV